MNREVKTLCPYCGVGCGLIATTNGPRLLRVRGDPDHPANFGKICQKGATVAMTVHAPTRLHYPMIRDERGKHAIVSTAAAIQHVGRKLEQILQHDGPGALSQRALCRAQSVAPEPFPISAHDLSPVNPSRPGR